MGKKSQTKSNKSSPQVSYDFSTERENSSSPCWHRLRNGDTEIKFSKKQKQYNISEILYFSSKVMCSLRVKTENYYKKGEKKALKKKNQDPIDESINFSEKAQQHLIYQIINFIQDDTSSFIKMIRFTNVDNFPTLQEFLTMDYNAQQNLLQPLFRSLENGLNQFKKYQIKMNNKAKNPERLDEEKQIIYIKQNELKCLFLGYLLLVQNDSLSQFDLTTQQLTRELFEKILKVLLSKTKVFNSQILNYIQNYWIIIMKLVRQYEIDVYSDSKSQTQLVELDDQSTPESLLEVVQRGDSIGGSSQEEKHDLMSIRFEEDNYVPNQSENPALYDLARSRMDCESYHNKNQIQEQNDIQKYQINSICNHRKDAIQKRFKRSIRQKKIQFQFQKRRYLLIYLLNKRLMHYINIEDDKELKIINIIKNKQIQLFKDFKNNKVNWHGIWQIIYIMHLKVLVQNLKIVQKKLQEVQTLISKYLFFYTKILFHR